MRKPFGKCRTDPKSSLSLELGVSIYTTGQKFYKKTNFKPNNCGENITIQQSCCQAVGRGECGVHLLPVTKSEACMEVMPSL